jgi:hypothetical protein
MRFLWRALMWFFGSAADRVSAVWIREQTYGPSCTDRGR